MTSRPGFIVASHEIAEVEGTYPDSKEVLGTTRVLGVAVGLTRIGAGIDRISPGQRTSYPHAHSREEEFVYVLEGELDAWIDGELHRVRAGDFIGFAAGTGIAHTFINDGERDAVLFVCGEHQVPADQVMYPKNPERRAKMRSGRWWSEAPNRALGAHDGKPARR